MPIEIIQKKEPRLAGSVWLLVVSIIAIVIIAAALIIVLGNKKNKDRQQNPVEANNTLVSNNNGQVSSAPIQGLVSLRLVDSNQAIQVGQEFQVELWLDSQSFNINLANMAVIYDSEYLDLIATPIIDSRGEIVRRDSLDVSKTVMGLSARDDSGPDQIKVLRGAGGDGDPYDNDDGFTGQGLFGVATFRALKSGSTSLEFNQDETKLFLDDGQGSVLHVDFDDLIINIGKAD